MLLVELKATADLDQQHSLYSPKTYNLVYNNNVILLLYYWIPELAGTIAVFSKEGWRWISDTSPLSPPSGGGPSTVSAGGKTAFSELHRHWYCQIIIKYL